MSTTTRLRISAVALTALLLTPSCTFSSRLDYDYTGRSAYQLAAVPVADGPDEVYELHVQPGVGPAYLTVQRRKQVSYRSTGLKLTELDKARAEKLKPNTAPYAGLLVRSVEPDSAAAAAGIQPGDLITHVNDQPSYYLSHYNTVVDKLGPEEAVEFRVRGREEVVRVAPDTRERTQRDKVRVPLESPKEPSRRPYAGVRLNVIPKEYSRKIYGDDRNAVVIGGVILGSPAYLAGLRSGDVIESVNGEPTPTLDELQQRIRESGVNGERMEFGVVRDRGEGYQADVALEDYSGVTKVRIPLVFSVESAAWETEWKAAWGILASYRSRYLASDTRAPEKTGHYSMALGLFRYSWGRRGSTLRLLWFIPISWS